VTTIEHDVETANHRPHTYAERVAIAFRDLIITAVCLGLFVAWLTSIAPGRMPT
jgi:hypothetical protein